MAGQPKKPIPSQRTIYPPPEMRLLTIEGLSTGNQWVFTRPAFFCGETPGPGGDRSRERSRLLRGIRHAATFVVGLVVRSVEVDLKKSPTGLDEKNHHLETSCDVKFQQLYP